MANCKNCGTYVEDNQKFCPNCGAKMDDKSLTKEDMQKFLTNLNDTPDYTSHFESEDIEKNKIISCLAYLSWLVLIPILGAENSKYAKFHCNQGLVLAVLEILLSVVFGFLKNFPLVGWIFVIISKLFGIGFVALSILGIYNAYTGKVKELPFVGSIKLLK